MRMNRRGRWHEISLRRIMPIKSGRNVNLSMNALRTDRYYNGHACSRRRRNALPAMLVALLVLHCYNICSSHQTRPCRTRRRNNTGFYYGLRDDDMTVFRHSWSIRGDFSNGGSILQSSLSGSKIDVRLSEDTQQKTLHDDMLDEVQYSTRCHSYSKCRPGNISQSLIIKRNELMQSLSQTLTQSLLLPLPHCRVGGVTARHKRTTNGMVCSILNRSRLPDILIRQPSTQQKDNINVVRTTSSIVRSKPKTQSRKKRRKNNTGFYYGIREDVFILPEKSVAPEKGTFSGRLMFPGGRRFDKEPNVGDTQGQLPKASVDSEKFDNRLSNNDKGVNFKDPDLARENLAKEEKLNEQREDTPLMNQATPDAQPRSAYFDEDNHGKEKKRKASVKQRTPSPSEPDEGTKKSKKNKQQIGKVQQHTQPSSQSTSGISSMIFDETLQELRQMRNEIIALREELRSLKGKFHEGEEAIITAPSSDDSEKDTEKSRWWHRPSPKEHMEPEMGTDAVDEALSLSPMEDTEKEDDQQPSPLSSSQQATPKLSRVARRREFEKIGRNVESWACRLLFEEKDKEGDGWKKITCNNFVRKKFNPEGRTQVYLKWMPDSRYDNDGYAAENDVTSIKTNGQQDYPCIKCYSIIDAPMDKVCSFLANEKTVPMYNELVEDHCDIEEITPHSKITWCKMPKVMFVKPRDFVTYCSHRWWRDGTQVIVNQACEHEDMPGVLVEGEGDVCRGYALRGANFISKDPDDPNKTRITMLAHANPGGGLPQWAMTTAVNAVVQIEPFKLFYNINEGVSKYNEPASSVSPSHQLASINTLPGRSNKPAGLAQMGYACFWPKGGGLKEKHTEQLDEVEESSITLE
ncbi:hypothetical protein ACHAW6_009100 [Cyclotella cf. meneghiniana]